MIFEGGEVIYGESWREGKESVLGRGVECLNVKGERESLVFCGLIV